MSIFQLMAVFSGILVPLILGFLCGAIRLFPDVPSAVGVLNRYALYVAFPALIAAGLLTPGFQLPSGHVVWLMVPAVYLTSIFVIQGLARFSPSLPGGSMAFVAVFGNVAYIGLPLCQGALGDEVTGAASISAALFMSTSLLMGPPNLLGGFSRGSLRLIFGQPLLWAPVVAMGVRRFFPGWVPDIYDLSMPVGRSAAPVALFLLGLYTHHQLRAMGRINLSTLAHIFGKLVVLPVVMAIFCVAAQRAGLLSRIMAQVFILLAATPTAVATFSLAEAYQRSQEEVAQSIVVGTLVSLFTLPLAVYLVVTYI